MRYATPQQPRLVLLSGRDDGTGNLVAGNGASRDVVFSPDGRWAAFVTEAGNLGAVPDGDGGSADVRMVPLAGGPGVELTPASLLTDPAGAAAQHRSVLFSPVVESLPGGGSRYTLVIGSTAAAVAGTPAGADPAAASDLLLLTVDVNAAGQAAAPVARMLTTAAGAVPVAWSPDGSRVLFISALNLDADPEALAQSLYALNVATGAVQRLASADAPFGHVAWGNDNASVAFDSTAVTVDATGDGLSDLRGADSNGVSDIFVLRLGSGAGGANQVERLTSFVSTGNAMPSVTGSVLTDARVGSGGAAGSLALTMSTDLVLPPSVDFGSNNQVFLRPTPQVMTVTGRTDATAGRSYSVIGNTTNGALPAGAGGGGDREPTGISFDSVAADLWSAPLVPSGQSLARQVYLHGPSLGTGLSRLMSQAADGSAANGASDDAVLLPRTVTYPELGLSVAGRDALPLQALAYETRATNLLPALANSAHTQIVLAAVEAPSGSTVVLDYGPNGAQSHGSTVFGVTLDSRSGALREFDGAINDLFTGSVSQRLGRVVSPAESVSVVLPELGNVTGGSGDDRFTVVGDGQRMSVDHPGLFAANSAVAIDGGGGLDVLDGQRQTHVKLTTHITGVEEVRFDPQTAASETGVVSLTSFSGLPVRNVEGSAGTDVLGITLVSFSGAPSSVDLRTLSIGNFGGGADRIDLSLARGTITANNQVALYVAVSDSGNVIVGGSRDDRFDLSKSLLGNNQAEGRDGDDGFIPGPGADSLDGGAGSDWLRVPDLDPFGAGVDPVTVDLAGQAHVGIAVAGDTFVGIENVTGTSADDTLIGDAFANRLEGSGGDDAVRGGDGDDVVDGGEGDDALDGGGGADTALFSGARSDYRLLGNPAPGAATVQLLDRRAGSPDGTDTLTDIETYRFTDGDYTLQQLIDSQLAELSIRADLSTLTVTEGTPPASGGVFQVELERDGDLSQPLTGTYRLMPVAAPGVPTVDAFDLDPALATDLPFTIDAGQSRVTISIPVLADLFRELNEQVRFELLGAPGAVLAPGQPATVGLEILNDDLVDPVFPRSPLPASAATRLDYELGSVLNPAQVPGTGLVARLDLDVPGNHLREVRANGATLFDGLASQRAVGAPWGTGSLGVTVVREGVVRLGATDDVVAVATNSLTSPQRLTLASIDGGAGTDTLLVAGVSNQFLGPLNGFEVLQLELDPHQAPMPTNFQPRTEVFLTMSDGQMPFQRVLGSAGWDDINLSVVIAPGHTTLDLSTLVLVNFGGPGSLDRISVGAGFDWNAQGAARPTTGLDLRAHPNVRLGASLTAIDDKVVGSELDDVIVDTYNIFLLDGSGNDRYEGRGGSDGLIGYGGDDTLVGGAGDDFLVGGRGSDVAEFSGPRGAYLVGGPAATPPGFPVDPALPNDPVVFEFSLTDQRPGSPDGRDSTLGIERFRFSDGEVSLAELLQGPLPPVVQLASATVADAAEGTAPTTAPGVLRFEVLRTGSLAQPIEVRFSLAGSGPNPAALDDVGVVTSPAGVAAVSPGQYAVVIPAGQDRVQVHVTPVADAVVEPDEALGLQITSVSVGTLGTVTTSRGVILNDDLPAPALLPQVSLAPGTAPSSTEDAGPGGSPPVLRFMVQRADGDLSLPTTVAFRVQPGSAPAADGLDLSRVLANGQQVLASGPGMSSLGDAELVFAPGQTEAAIEVFTAGDALVEPDEHLQLVLLSATDGLLQANGQLSAQGTIINDDVALQFPLLTGAREALEDRPWALTITPQPAGIDASALQFRIDWGDGSAVQTLTGATLAAQGGVVTHTFADDPDGPVNRVAQTVHVQVTDPASQQVVGNNASVDVVDVAPAMTGFFGYPSPFIEHGTVMALTQGALTDVAGDPVLQRFIEWGDGPAQPLPLQGPATHSWTGLGHHQVAAFVVNDDGTFEVARTEVAITATAGGAAPNGTPAQWAAAWTDSLMSFSHKANGDNAAEAWSAVTLSAVNSGVLTGGDVYGGLLGVSGQSAATSTVRQEIDGREALRVSLTGGERADSLIVDLARLFTSDAPGLNEAAVLQLYDGSRLVNTVALQAANANGRLHVELLNQPVFDSVIFRAGTLDENAGGVFRPGGLVDSQGGYVPAAPSLGSDYLIEAVQFLDLPDVPLVGLASAFGG